MRGNNIVVGPSRLQLIRKIGLSLQKKVQRNVSCLCSGLHFYKRVFRLMYLLTRFRVEESQSFGMSDVCNAVTTWLPSNLPSSTPHWSNGFICQSVPSVNTLCSYAAISEPSVSGVNESRINMELGRLPGCTL